MRIFKVLMILTLCLLGMGFSMYKLRISASEAILLGINPAFIFMLR